jgi:aminoglycoside phosphotransferase (APT) family kinase protein
MGRATEATQCTSSMVRRIANLAFDLPAVVAALLDAEISAAFPETDVSAMTLIDRGFGSVVVGVSGSFVVRVPRTTTVAVAHRHELGLLSPLRGRVDVSLPSAVWSCSPTPAVPWGATAYTWLDGPSPHLRYHQTTGRESRSAIPRKTWLYSATSATTPLR